MDITEIEREAINLIVAENISKFEIKANLKSISFNTTNNLNSKKNNFLGDKMEYQKEFQSIPVFEAPKFNMEGTQIKIDEVVNKEVAFLDLNVQASSFYEGEYAAVQIQNDLNEKQWFRTSSAVLIKQLKDLKEKQKLPIRSTVKKVKRYYTLS